VTVEGVGLGSEYLVFVRKCSLRISDEIFCSIRGAVASISPSKEYSPFSYYFASQKRKYFVQHSVIEHCQSG
jgi:hypothetical protein